MLRSSRELWWAFFAGILITAIYGAVYLATRKIPAAGELFGHTIGIIGFILMLLTETLYSLRKRTRSANWGRMSSWLQFHIFTGLVGPYMVLLHTSWKFNGLAGITTLFTVVIVISGFVGRYIYTRIHARWTVSKLKARFRRRRSGARVNSCRSGIRFTFQLVWCCSFLLSSTLAAHSITPRFLNKRAL